jgi:hypothetical protein
LLSRKAPRTMIPETETKTHMKRFHTLALRFLTVAALLTFGLLPAWAQQDSSSSAPSGSTPSSADQGSDTGNGAAPAATVPGSGPNIENPPLSGLDEPSFEAAYGGRSYLVPGLQLSESVNTSTSGVGSKNSGTDETARGLGSIDLQKLWKNYQVALDYVAGGTVYQGHIFQSHIGRAYQTHSLALDNRVLWRNGQLAFRDSFSYLPEGAFGFSSYGGAGGFGSTLGGGGTNGGAGTGLGGITGGAPGSGTLGGGSIGSVGIQPRIDNLSIIDVSQSFSARSTATAAVSYDYTDFLKNAQTSLSLINSQMSSAQIGYDYLLNRHDRLSATYTIQSFHFPRTGSGNVESHQWHILYGRRVSGRMNLVFGGGPQLIVFHNLIAVPSKLTASGRAQLSYQVNARNSIQVSYLHYTSAGSGFFAGANTDLVDGSLSRLAGRNWTFNINTGFSRNSSLQTSLLGAAAANTYDYFYGGSSIRRKLGRDFGIFASYQYSDIRFNTSICTNVGTCGRSTGQNVGLVGIDWHPHPFRLD